MSKRVIIGSRGSALAMVQTQLVLEKLRALFPRAEFVIMKIKTEGDRRPEAALEKKIGGKGLFTKEIEEALLARRIDLAVHSLKDLPTELPKGLIIGAILPRADPRDVLVSGGNLKLAQLPQNARLGTDSPRRRVQLLAYRRGFQIMSLRGNVETRLRKLDDGQYDAIVLAAAGLTRLGLENRVTEYLSTELMLPAPGQGALAVEIREDDKPIQALVRPLDHAQTRLAIEAERAFLHRLGGGCRVPIAAYAQLASDRLTIEGLIASDDGTRLFRDTLSADPELPSEAGKQLAERLLAQGAEEILEEARHGSPHLNMTQRPLRGRRILVTRAQAQAGLFSEKLRALGAEPIEFPTITIAPLEDFSLLDCAIQQLAASQYDWIIFTSVNGVRCFCERLIALGYDLRLLSTVKLGVIGPATAAALNQLELRADYMPTRYLAEEIAAGIGDVRGQRLLLPRADIARKELAEALRATGALVDEVAAYRTLPADSEAAQLQKLLGFGEIDLITFTSASTVRHFAHLLGGLDLGRVVGHAKIACIGPITAKAAQELGLKVDILAEEQTIEGLLQAIVRELGNHARFKAKTKLLA